MYAPKTTYGKALARDDIRLQDVFSVGFATFDTSNCKEEALINLTVFRFASNVNGIL
ncbi:hypothetical protein [Flavisericum labens]|uniref:hypothetical protein n=1 Tax=Flavisericum labens TaxID=3377112 RepID=UPI00387B4957